MHSTPLLLLLFIGTPLLAQVSPASSPYFADLHERFNDYKFRTFTDPQRMAWLLVDSAVDHGLRDPEVWDCSAESYSYRVASAYGRRLIRNTAQFGFETLLREDSRYRPSGSRNFTRRVYVAIRSSVLAYHPDGSLRPAYGRIAAGAVASATASTWHPQSMNGSTLLAGVAQSALDRAGNNLLTEFTPDLKAFGLSTWNRLTKK